MIGSLAVALIGAALWGTAGQQPVFRSRVDLVTVDVTVLGPRRRTGRGPRRRPTSRWRLTARPRRIVWAEFVSRRPLPAGVPAKHRALLVERGCRHRAADPDRGGPGAHPPHRRARGVARGRGVRRRAGSVRPRGRDHRSTRTARFEFTTEHGVVKRALQRLTGEATADAGALLDRPDRGARDRRRRPDAAGPGRAARVRPAARTVREPAPDGREPTPCGIRARCRSSRKGGPWRSRRAPTGGPRSMRSGT